MKSPNQQPPHAEPAMKQGNALLSTFFLLTGLSFPATIHAQRPVRPSDLSLSRGLIAHWAFDDALDPGRDSVGTHSANSICVGAACPTISVVDMAPIHGNQGALLLTGSGERLSVPHSPDLNQPSSLSLWLKRTQDRCIYHVLGKRASCGGPSHQTGTHYQMARGCTAGHTGFLGFGSCGTTTPCSSNNIGTDLPWNMWVHVAWVYDGTASTMYLNGQAVTVNSTWVWGTTNSTAALVIGNSDTCSTAQSFPGLIDDLRLYERALSASEVWLLSRGFH